jgi:hypothetical protein
MRWAAVVAIAHRPPVIGVPSRATVVTFAPRTTLLNATVGGRSVARSMLA